MTSIFPASSRPPGRRGCGDGGGCRVDDGGVDDASALVWFADALYCVAERMLRAAEICGGSTRPPPPADAAATAPATALDAIPDRGGNDGDVDDPLDFTILELLTMESSDSLDDGSTGLECSRGFGQSLDDGSTASMTKSSTSVSSRSRLGTCEANECLPPSEENRALDATLAAGSLDEITDPYHDIACAGRLGISPLIHDIGNENTFSDFLTNGSHYGLEGDSWQQSITTPSWILHENNHFYFPSLSSNDDATSLSWISSSITVRQMTIGGIQAHDESLDNWTPSPKQPCPTRVYGANPTAAEHPEAVKGDRCRAIHPHTRGRRIPQEGIISYEAYEARKCGNNEKEKRHKQQKPPDTSAAAATTSSTSAIATGWNRTMLTKAKTRRRKMRTSGSF